MRDDPKVAVLREEMERFIDLQKEGYDHLFNPKTGTFFFDGMPLPTVLWAGTTAGETGSPVR